MLRDGDIGKALVENASILVRQLWEYIRGQLRVLQCVLKKWSTESPRHVWYVV